MAKELKKVEQERLNQIYNLIQEPSLSQAERDILIRSKNEIEKGGMFELHMINLRNRLLPLIVSQKISVKAKVFYLELREDRKIGLGEGISLFKEL